MQKMLSMLRRGVVLALSCYEFAIAITTSLLVDNHFRLCQRANIYMESGKESMAATCIQVRPSSIVSSQDNDHSKARRVHVYLSPNMLQRGKLGRQHQQN